MLLQIEGKTYEEAKVIANFNDMRIRIVELDGVRQTIKNKSLVQKRVLVAVKDNIVIHAEVG